MAHRRIQSWTVNKTNAATATMYRDAEYDEWIVKLTVNGAREHGADYFTNSKQDAFMTMKAMARQAAGPDLIPATA